MDRVSDRKYKDDYVGINRHAGKTPKVVINHLVMISERRAFDIQQIDYKDRFSVFNSIENTFEINDNDTVSEVKRALTEIESKTVLSDKLRFLCEANLSEKIREIVESQMDEKVREYLALGKDRIKACGYNIALLNKELQDKCTTSQGKLELLVYSEFTIGDKISRAEVKKKLARIYEKVGINATAKSVDLEKWFKIEETSFKENGKKIRSFLIVSKRT